MVKINQCFILFALLSARVRSETSIAACQYGGRGVSTIPSMISQRGCTDHGDGTRCTPHSRRPVISMDGFMVAATHEPQECCIEAKTRRRMHHAHLQKNILHGHAAILLPMSPTLCAGGERGHHLDFSDDLVEGRCCIEEGELDRGKGSL